MGHPPCRCGLPYELDIDLEYRCFTCQPLPPVGWLWRVLSEARLAASGSGSELANAEALPSPGLTSNPSNPNPQRSE
jgi:hypothetical protein